MGHQMSDIGSLRTRRGPRFENLVGGLDRTGAAARSFPSSFACVIPSASSSVPLSPSPLRFPHPCLLLIAPCLATSHAELRPEESGRIHCSAEPLNLLSNASACISL